jgi:hypothetical protein
MRLARSDGLSPEGHASVSDPCPDPRQSGDFRRLKSGHRRLGEIAAGTTALHPDSPGGAAGAVFAPVVASAVSDLTGKRILQC